MNNVRKEANSVLHHAPLICDRHDPVKMYAFAEVQAKRVLLLEKAYRYRRVCEALLGQYWIERTYSYPSAEEKVLAKLHEYQAKATDLYQQAEKSN